MIIEIQRVGFVNKGAELMLLAILEKLRAAYPDAIVTIMPTTRQNARPYRKLLETGLYPKADLYYAGLRWGPLASLLPRRIREMYGLVLDREVEVVIDAAGFAYSDQWGDQSVLELEKSARRWRRQGTNVILMPQAFGPFKGERIRRAMRRAAENIDMLVARESTSFKYLAEVAGEHPNIHQYPDFTNLIKGVVPEYFEPAEHRVCIVPNYRMIDKTDEAQSAAYVPFMQLCARHLAEKGAKPFLLLHEGKNDAWLTEQISSAAGGIPILKEENPLKIKGILGASYATIGSRFHGLVSALSQGVPSLATGWSHKYVELFRDYGYPEGVVPVRNNHDELRQKLDQLIDEESHRELSARLLSASDRLKSLSEAMWERVFAVIDRKG